MSAPLPNPTSRATTPPLLWILLAVGTLAAVTPLWVVDVLPFQDLPGHLATARVLHDLRAGSELYARVYVQAPAPLPNTLVFALMDWLAGLMPLHVAATVTLTAASVALPLSSLALARTFGRSPWLALFSLFLVFNYPLGRGFLAYATGIPVLLLAIAAAHQDAVRPSWSRLVTLAGLIALGFFAHAQIYLMIMLCGGVVVVLSWGGWRAFLRRLAPYALGSVPFAIWFWRTFVARVGQAPISYSAASDGFGARWTPLGDLIVSARQFVIAIFPSRADEVTLAGMAVLLAVLLGVQVAHRRTGGRTVQALPGYRPWTLPILTVVMFVSYVVVPAHMKGQASISYRFLPVAVLLLSLCGDMPRRAWVAAALATAITAGAAGWSAQVARELQSYVATNVGDIRGLMDLAQPGRRLAYLRLDTRSYTQLEWRTAWYLDSWYMVFRHGLVQMNFHYTYPNHVAYAPGREPPRTPRSDPEAFFRRGLDQYYDYLLIYGPAHVDFGAFATRLRLLGRSGRLTLYAIEGSAEGTRAPPDRDPRGTSPG
ncbi:MAG: hypothetical protein AMXMBFR64_24810 [Myxococcales bacterium]